MFRNLEANEIEVRVQSVKKSKSNVGAILLLYKNSRCDMQLLDETVGIYNWQREHKRENHNCIVSIWDDAKGQWISKEDTGTESNTEAQKGLASDSFKRACFNWGIGRELYTAPFTWVNLDPSEHYEVQGKERLSNWVKFYVSEIITSDIKVIETLVIKDQTGKIRFSTKLKHDKKPTGETPTQDFNSHVTEMAKKLGDVVGVTVEECNAFIDNKAEWGQPKKDAMKKSCKTDPVMRSNIVTGVIK